MPDLEDLESLRRWDEPNWHWEGLKTWPTEAIIEKLRSLNVIVDIEDFKQQAQNSISAEDLANDVFYKTTTATGYDEDFIWMAAIELWKRLLPDRPSVEIIGGQIDDVIDAAAVLEEDRQYQEAAQREAQLVPYLQQHLLDETGRLKETFYQRLQPCSMYKLDELFYFMVWRLLMAGFGEEARQMTQLVTQCFQDDRGADARALALILSGHVSEGLQLYEQILERNPKNAFYWMHAGDLWAFGQKTKDLGKAEGYYKKAEGLAERWARAHSQRQQEQGHEALWLLAQRFVLLYRALGREAEAKRYEAKLEALEYEDESEPTPAFQPQPKVGRNEPCPCGSGKKYKYCCGS
jgi:hypothetical protein